MAAALLATRILLAGVFIVAGAAKLADIAGSRQAVIGFGVPERVAGIAGRLLPLAELCVGVALIPTGTAVAGAIGAIVLLVAFVAAIATALARGRAPDCHCFGQVHSAPAGPATLARNAVLLGVAAFVAIGGWNDAGASATQWVTTASTAALVAIAAGVVIALLIAFQVWFSLQLLSQNGRVISRLDEMERTLAGLTSDGKIAAKPDLAPAFSLPDVDGRTHTLDSLMVGQPRLMLVFSDADCGPCNALMPELAEWQRAHAERLGFIVIAGGEAGRNRAKASEHGLDRMLLDEGRDVAEAFGARLTPAAMIVGPGRVIEAPVVAGADAIRALLPPAAVRPAAEEPIGRPAPELELPGLDGRPLDLSDLYRDRTLAIFWNPECGFCQQMLPDLRAFEADPPPGAPRVVVISSGDAERVRADGLRSPVVLDPGSEAMRAFGISGTPMGVLVEDGRIASPVAAGAAAVLELAGVGGEMPQIVHAGGGGQAR
jgi:thiol-disulfide isomerase/thioredoxin